MANPTNIAFSKLSPEELRYLDPSTLSNIDWTDFSSFSKEQLIALGEIISTADESQQSICFTIPPFILGPLPQSSTNETHFSRNFRWQEIHYSSSIGKPIPAGSAARIIILYIVTTVVRTREPKVDLKESVTELMRNFGIKPSYGTKGTVSKYEAALASLAHTIIELRLKSNDGETETVQEMRFPIFSYDSLTFGPSGLIRGVAQISDDFFRLILESTVILNRQTVANLSRGRSPAALDIYIWSTYTNYYLARAKRANVKLSWDEAYEMFSNKDKPRKYFKRDFAQKLALVEKQYPALRLVPCDIGITLWRTETHIAAPQSKPLIGRTGK